MQRVQIEWALVETGLSQTAAERPARTDPAFTSSELEGARLAFERDKLLAEAEAVRLGLLLRIEDGGVLGLAEGEP